MKDFRTSATILTKVGHDEGNPAAAETGRGAKIGLAILLFILLVVGFCTIARAAMRPLWHDELFTVIATRLASHAALWNGLADGVDAHPPLYYEIGRACRHWIVSDEIGYRLPSVIGLLGTIFFLYLALSRKVDRLAAFAGAFIVLGTQLEFFASEARPYALMIACVSGAILAWQTIDAWRLGSVALAILLAAAVSLHYYAVLVLPAFLLAEATILFVHRRFRLWAWAALLVSPLPLLFFAPLISKVREYYGGNFWARPSLSLLFGEHGWVFNLQGGYWGLALAVIAAAGLLYWSNSSMRGAAPQIEDSVLAAALLIMPIIAIPFAMFTNVGVADRYLLPTVLGGALAVGYFLNGVPRKVRIAALVVIFLDYGQDLYVTRPAAFGGQTADRRGAVGEAQLYNQFSREAGVPVVIAGGHEYLQWAYYASPDFRADFHFLADRAAAIKYAGHDSVDSALMVLRRYVPLQVDDYDRFISVHKEFLVVSKSGSGEWLLARLSAEDQSLSLIALRGSAKIYRVSLKPVETR